ncbi:6-bladed beta-propeller [Parabacteroides sp. OttesenSCG-928-G06]|nr:6-bladed beta-propeller [Parabacteroides sp. OttesenSCG-928-G06]
MKQKPSLLAYLSVCCLFIACNSQQVQKEEIVVIDVTKKYPEKEILLSDIADITYVQMDESKDEYLYKGALIRLTDNYFVIYNNATGDVLFFTKEGMPSSKFNRKGNGPGEYTSINSKLVWYDEKSDDLYVKIKKSVDVFSSTGNYKRSLPLPEDITPGEMMLLTDGSLILFDQTEEHKKGRAHFAKDNDSPEEENPSRFLRIDSQTGEVLETITLPKLHNIDFSVVVSGFLVFHSYANVKHQLSHPEGVLLHTQDSDTIYLYNYNKKTMTPVMVQNPPLASLPSRIYLNPFMETDSYQFIEYVTIDDEYGKKGRMPSTNLVRDKSTGEIYTQKIVLDDFPEKEIFISPQLMTITQDSQTAFIELYFGKLMEAYEKGQLKGKLKEMVASMNEEAENSVFIIVKFK